MLEHIIQEITGAPITTLLGSPLSQFSVEEQLRWAAKRNTHIRRTTIAKLL
jgi:hypothetical protein